MLLASVASCINLVQLATVRPNKGKHSNCFSVMESLNAMKPWRLLQDSTVYFTVFIFHEFSLAWLCKTFVPINDLPWQKKMQEIDLSSPSNIMKALKSNKVPARILRWQTLINRKGEKHTRKTSHTLICLSFHFNIAHSECAFFERRPFTLNLFLANEGNLLNSISCFFLRLSVEMPVRLERYTTFL